MVHYAIFNIISVESGSFLNWTYIYKCTSPYIEPLLNCHGTSQGKSAHNSCTSWVSPEQDYGSEASFPRTLPGKAKWIHWSSNTRPPDHESQTLLLSRTGPLENVEAKCRNVSAVTVDNKEFFCTMFTRNVATRQEVNQTTVQEVQVTGSNRHEIM